MARILVTGGAGYIGSHTVPLLVAAGHEVAVYDDLSSGLREVLVPGQRVIVGRVQDELSLNRAFYQMRPDVVVHLAAAVEPAWSASQPARFFATNVEGVITLANLLRYYEVPVVFSSSSAVYGAPTELPVVETEPLKPESLYGDTKVIGEQVFNAYAKAYGIRMIILRHFNAAGVGLLAENGVAHRHRIHLIAVACQAALGVGPVVDIYGADYDTPVRAFTMWEQENQIPCEMFSIQFNVSRAGSFHTELSTGDQEIHPRYGLTVISFRGNSAGSPVIQTWMKLRPLRGFGIAPTLWVLMDTATCQAEATLDRVCVFCTN
jgi:hypothetical protein